MKLKAGKDYKKNVYVLDDNGDLLTFKEFIDDYKNVSIESYFRVTISAHDLIMEGTDGRLKYLASTTDLKVDVHGTKLGIWGTFGSGDDFVRVGSGGSNVELGEGRNVFRGGDGKDGVTGGTQADTLHGGGGNDVIRGGGGKDVLSGGKGKDFFSYEAFEDFKARITDFKVGEDKLNLMGWYRGDISIKNVDGGVLLTNPENSSDSILLEGVRRKELLADDSWFV